MLKHEPLTVRLPLGMRQRLADSAKANRRSMNAELVVHLEAALTRQPATVAPAQAEHAATRG